jgi:FixJ family two-component response regulator
MSADGTVFVIDDSQEMRSSLTRVLTAGHYKVRSFDSAAQFLQEQDPIEPGCLLLDVFMPHMNGLELQCTLRTAPCARPIVFLSGTADIETSVTAMKAGAIDFLTKPIDSEQLFAAVDRALSRDAEQRRYQAARLVTERRFNSMTSRERQVMAFILRGLLNKQIAAHMGIGEKTVKVHRARLMSKMRVRSVAALVECGLQIGLAIAPVLRDPGAGLGWQASERLVRSSSRTRSRE